MKNKSSTRPFAEDDFFKDRSSSRPLVEGTVARGHLKEPTPFFTGRDQGQFIDHSPVPVTKAFLKHGEDRFDIYCAVCHGRTGEGNGMVVQRGFPRPLSYFSGLVKHEPLGYYFDVMANGKGDMAPEKDVLDEEDRWAIAVYIRALQRSREGHLADAPRAVQEKLKALNAKDAGPVYE